VLLWLDHWLGDEDLPAQHSSDEHASIVDRPMSSMCSVPRCAVTKNENGGRAIWLATQQSDVRHVPIKNVKQQAVLSMR
jgi:hypothetical protein